MHPIIIKGRKHNKGFNLLGIKAQGQVFPFVFLRLSSNFSHHYFAELKFPLTENNGNQGNNSDINLLSLFALTKFPISTTTNFKMSIHEV